ncbi:methionyl-tRNA formyltransferase [Adlercreutzia aquisgranensis]|uniref:methionyl-tRNA formyltransferase n=1 Tax=Adlercreutzia aquisgranensis TaxID=2941323 RepID=UPI002040F6D9|nr:methionyl-tRNA formyltransferase [Adlercreutzia aquisgranensis]
MRIVFMGTPEFSATILGYLAEQHDVVAAYTRPDAVRGRGKALEPSPVKSLAQSLGIPVFTPRSLRDEQVVAELAELQPDAIVVAAYGMLLPKAVLDIPRYGCINVHASLLPRWRGAAPVERAILAGDEETGVCIMAMEEGLDTGPYCVCRTTSVAGKSVRELTEELASLGASALLHGLTMVASQPHPFVAQSEEGITYASKIGKGELNLRPSDGAEEALRKVLASSDAHPCKVVVCGRPLTVLVAERAAEQRPPLACGQVAVSGKRVVLGMADGAIELASVRPDGKKTMDAAAFAAGIRGSKDATMMWEEFGVR